MENRALSNPLALSFKVVDNLLIPWRGMIQQDLDGILLVLTSPPTP